MDKKTTSEKDRSDLERYKVVQSEATKRIISIAALFIVALSFVLFMIYAPAQRHILAYFMGGALVIIVAGVVGYQNIRIRTKMGSVNVGKKRK